MRLFHARHSESVFQLVILSEGRSPKRTTESKDLRLLFGKTPCQPLQKTTYRFSFPLESQTTESRGERLLHRPPL